MLLATAQEGDQPRLLRRYDPRTAVFEPDLPVTCENGTFHPIGYRFDPETGDVVLTGECVRRGGNKAHLFRGGTGQGVHLPANDVEVRGAAIGVRRTPEGWSLYRLGDPGTTLVALSDRGLGLRIPELHVDTARGWAVGQDYGGRRFALWRLDGSAPHLYDALGESYALTDDALWLLTGQRGKETLYRLALPSQVPDKES